MALRDTIKKVLELDKLIKNESTGSVKELAMKIQLTERHVYNYIKIFNDIGRATHFDNQKNSYVYVNKEYPQQGLG